MNFARPSFDSSASTNQIDWAMPRTKALLKARRRDAAGLKASLTTLGGQIRRQTPTIETVVLVVWAITPLLVAAVAAAW
jgi:hypothetical protein